MQLTLNMPDIQPLSGLIEKPTSFCLVKFDKINHYFICIVDKYSY
jgi:hypothetical protein